MGVWWEFPGSGIMTPCTRRFPPAPCSRRSSSSGATLAVNQSSNRAIINWGSFSIGAGESATFNLPSANSAVLNRVTGSQLSSLMGTLASNGQVYLLKSTTRAS